MKNANPKDMTLADILDLRAKVAEFKERQALALEAELRELTARKLSVPGVTASAAGRKPGPTKKTEQTATKKAPAKGTKVIKKAPATRTRYANPENKNETYAGIGVRPNWLKAKLAEGASLEDFAVT